VIAVSDGQGDSSTLLPAFLALVGVTATLGAINAVLQQQQRLLSELVSRHTLDEIIDVSTKVPYASFETPVFHDQLARARTSGVYRPIEMVQAVTTLTMSVLTSLGICAVLLHVYPPLVPLVALATLPLLASTLYTSRQVYYFEYALTPHSRERMYLTDLLTERDTAKELRVFGSTRFLQKRYRVLSDERIERLRVFLRKRLVVALSGNFATAVGSALALGSLGLLLTSNRISVASAVTAGIAMQMLASRLSSITGGIGKLIEAGLFLDDYRDFLRLGEEETRSSAALERRAPSTNRFEGLRLESVSFTYPSTGVEVLEDIDLEIAPGEVVALVGENGSGKTTLVKLICQLYGPSAGRMVWNGSDVAELDPVAVRSRMTVLFQDYIQYHLTARDNIVLGRVDGEPDDAAVIAAARQSGAEGLIERLPEGYDTRLGRQFAGGHELSIGQWQRLALARAIFRGGDFLVLDEPTASLDPRAEHDLFEQMRNLAQGKSVLLVSHRFSSVRSADRIYVMHAGRITESGSHDELMARGGHYAELFRLQAAAYLGDHSAGATA
jgi:ATP-binding cassette subfamily B protein